MPSVGWMKKSGQWGCPWRGSHFHVPNMFYKAWNVIHPNAVLSGMCSFSCTRLVMITGFNIRASLNPGFAGRLAPGELLFPGVRHSGHVDWRGWALRWWAYICRSMQLLTIPQKEHLIWPAENLKRIYRRTMKVLCNYKSTVSYVKLRSLQFVP